jgi:hypothetical protein
MFSRFRQNRGLMKKRDETRMGVLMQVGRKRVFGLRPCEAESTLQLFAASVKEIEGIFQF